MVMADVNVYGKQSGSGNEDEGGEPWDGIQKWTKQSERAIS